MKTRKWTMLGVAHADASDLTTEVYLQGGPVIGVGEQVDVIESREVENLRKALMHARQHLSHELGGAHYQRFLEQSLKLERGEE